jgi:hypothetical protein
MKKSIVILLLIPVTSVYAQDIDYVSSTLFSGFFNSIFIEGDNAYCGTEHAFQVVSIGDLGNPLYSWGFPTMNILDAVVIGNYAYFGNASPILNSYFNSYDISEPYNCIKLDSVFNYGVVYPITLSGGYAFTIKAYYGFYVIDISNPYDLNIVAEFQTPGEPNYIFVAGDYAYVTTWDDGLFIVDITDFQNMYVVGNFPSSVFSTCVFVEGSYAYFTESIGNIFDAFLTIINIDDPSNPTFTGRYQSTGYFSQVKIADDYAFIISQLEFGRDLLIVDISQPSSPNLLGNYHPTGGIVDINVEIPYCFTVGGNPELSVLNVSDPQNPQLVGQFEAPAYLYVIALKDSVAFAGAEDGLWTVDISEISIPVIIGQDRTTGNIKGIDVDGNYAFTCVYANGLTILDISDPSSPEYVGSYSEPGIYSVFVLGDYAYMTDFIDGLVIANIADPSNPIFTSNLQLPGYSDDIYILGAYAYIANHQNGLYIVDITDISNPVMVDSCDTPGSAVGVYVDGDFAYIADSDSGLQIINVQDPTNPTLIFNVETEDRARDVVVLADYAIVADDSAGIQVVDISDLGTPVILTDYDTPGRALDLEIDGDYIYVADYYSLMILHLNRETGILEQTSFPSEFTLSQNYPNPFNARTAIHYNIPVASPAVLEVFDILGRKVETLVDGFRSPGSYTAIWNASNLSSGLYLYRLRSNEYSEIRRMTLIK